MKRIVSTEIISSGLSDPSFSAAVIGWQKQHGRHALPWQNTRDAYRIWLSEIMLQQTQVTAVIPYYQRFLSRFPDVDSLASATSEEVMAHWSGLGYYTRARNLHRCAQEVVAKYASQFPADPLLLAELPGIGRSTAAAIAAFAYGVRAAILDGNVKRVFARVFGVEGYPGEKKTEAALWLRAQALLPAQEGIEAYTQGLMDLGASLCSRSKPACPRCPLQSRCVALATERVAQLPVRKPKRAIPEKHAHLLVLLADGKILLETRPPLGIWGGLLSLPEIAGHTSEADVMAAADIASWVGTRYGAVQTCAALPGFTHVFTHFKLHIQAWRIELKARPLQVAQLETQWLSVAECAQAGLPAPVKKLLLALPGMALNASPTTI